MTSAPAAGERESPSNGLAEIYRELEAVGVHNINLVNPTHFVPAILRAFKSTARRFLGVYNSSGCERLEHPAPAGRLGGRPFARPQICLPAEKAGRYSAAPDYFAHASAAVAEMARQTGPAVPDGDGLLRRGTVVRHLILPENTNDSIRLLEGGSDEQLSDRVLVSLMGQYLPLVGARRNFPELAPLAESSAANTARWRMSFCQLRAGRLCAAVFFGAKRITFPCLIWKGGAPRNIWKKLDKQR